MNFLWFAIIGIIAGWLSGQIMKGRGFGLVGNLVIGIIKIKIDNIVVAFQKFSKLTFNPFYMTLEYLFFILNIMN